MRNVNPIALKRIEGCENERAVIRTRQASGEILTAVPWRRFGWRASGGISSASR
jgi:hypothetical protein